ncbi:MAG: hypothetical protein JWN88_614 [Frankiales bacterium]|jgi:pimeloyl-ACP methyl ester carboxylesterase|nr:hypothetical protein [Frankiales bacterium]
MRSRAEAPAALDARIRSAERAAYGHYGLDPQERIVVVDTALGPVDVRLSVFGTASGDEPPVLLLHGVASATVLAAPLIPYLGTRQVIAVDWPGHGLSGASTLPVGSVLRDYAVAVVSGLLDGLGIAEVDLVGHSLGAQIGLYASLELPGRVRRLVLLGAPGAGFVGVKPSFVMKVLAVPGVGRRLLSLPMSRRSFVRANEQTLGVGALDGLSDDLLTAAMLLGTRADYAPSVASYFRALIKLGSVRGGVALTSDELGRLPQPTLAVWGDDDVFMRPLLAADSLVALRDLHLIRLAGAGHAPWLQAPERVGEAVAAHLGVAVEGAAPELEKRATG